MENKNIIMILVAIIVVLAVVAGAMFMQHNNAKDATQIKFLSENKLNEGDSLSVQLTDLNKTAISKQTVKITVSNKKGKVVVDKTLETNSKGKGKLDLDLKKGKYDVNVTYDGNENYTGCNSSQKLTIKQPTSEKVSSQNSNDYPEYNSDLGHYKRTGINQDEIGVVELSDGRYVVIAGDGYYEYNGQDSQGNIQRGSFLGHGGTSI